MTGLTDVDGFRICIQMCILCMINVEKKSFVHNERFPSHHFTHCKLKPVDSVNAEKGSQHGKETWFRIIALFYLSITHVTVRPSCFDTDFAAQIILI